MGVIRAGGVSALTTKAVATAAGRSEGSIYKHFRDKLDLISETVMSRLPDLIAVLAVLEPGVRTIQDNITPVIEALCAFYRDILPISGGILADPELLLRFQVRMPQQGRGPHRPHLLIAAYFAAEQDLGRLRHDTDVDALTYLLVGACLEAANVALMVGEDMVPLHGERFAPTIARTLLTGHSLTHITGH
jgi:AcrR family transcriptional regulator